MKHAFSKGVLSSKVLACLMAGSLLFAAGHAGAMTAAGTDIKNKATVTYEDSNGNSYSAQSNEAVVTVAAVFDATLEDDGTKFGAPGETVYFTHTLANTGNTPDTYTVSGGTYQVYLDANQNGQPDAGENVITSVTVNPGQQVQLILAIPVPSAAQPNTQINGVLTVTTANGTVRDIGANSDNADGTNNDTVNVTSNAVLVANKSSVVDFANNVITYTLEVKNNGSRPAKNVEIWDAIPANTTFLNIVSVNGLLGSNGDQWLNDQGTLQNLPHAYTPAALAEVDEPAGIDLNGNGITGETGLDGILFRDAELGVNTTVTIVYRVEFDPALPAGTAIRNVFVAQGDLDDDPGTTEPPVPSQPVTNYVRQTYNVIADDTNGGNNDYNHQPNDDVFIVNSAASGAVVTFYHTITNQGNGADVFELSVPSAGSANNNFPANTTFTLWNAAGTVQLTDTNNTGTVDTGALAAGASQVITVRASLPAGVHGAGPYTYTLTATSANDTTAPIADDTTQGTLNAINAPAVDLANSWSLDLSDGGLVDADAYQAGVAITTLTGAAGSTVTFPLYVANESGNAQSYNLSAVLPAGWSVVFRSIGVDTTNDGSANNTAGAGSVVTSTPNLPAGAIFMYEAEVTIASNVAQAQANFTGANNIGGAYPIEFRVVSTSNSNISDRKLDAVQVQANRAISVTPDGTNQVQPGGNVDYPHVLANTGNSVEIVALSATNSLVGSGWSNTTVVFSGATCTTTTALANLVVGPITLCNSAGQQVTVQVTAVNAGVPSIELAPGQNLRLRTTVFAPASAAQGNQDVLVLLAQNVDNAAPATASDSASDVTEVILGQVRLFKYAGVDADCSCATGNWTPDTPFAQVQTTQVAPGQCVIWQLRATNEGAATAYEVTITDEVTPFTQLEVDDNACVDSVDGANCSPSAGAIANTGLLPVVEWSIGNLLAGDSARARFCVKVD